MRPLHISFERVRDIFAAMQFEQIGGVPLSDVIGGGDPEYVASEILTAMAKYVDLPSQDSILDVGCGCGRIATGLTQYLSRTSISINLALPPPDPGQSVAARSLSQPGNSKRGGVAGLDPSRAKATGSWALAAS
jgi:hypothetical protein